MVRGVRRGCVRLKGAIIGIDNEDDSTFTITVDHKTFHFQAKNAAERENWVRALEETIFRHGSRIRWDNNRPPSTIKDFDNKVSETDAYLQLMIEQTKTLEDRIESISDEDEKAKCQMILENANAMLHNIKHSIVLLQIAKNTAHPVNGIYDINPINNAASNTDIAGDQIQTGVELGSECLEHARRHSTRSIVASATSLVVPETSYSSSEEEDDFFDANDSLFTPGSQATTPTCPRGMECGLRKAALRNMKQCGSYPGSMPIIHESVLLKSNHRQFANEEPVRPLSAPATTIPSTSRQVPLQSKLSVEENIDYDALYEEYDESDVEMESHGSIIRHLLGQVKIGMDLTKVVLPTFILERRSLLEMYADYFAHPDIFLKIADLKNPKDRMVQVVKWYLSSYHAGRKGSVAKKPYNPILGEIFRCYWDVPNYTSSGELVPDGPVPWCHKNQLTFVAEQVSHHPPTFYAEHYSKRISFNAHVYTKSKFLGLSICVYNIGLGTISVLDHDEEYTVTFPNGYGRSILTIPWIELGGSVHIECQKTGYYCNIEFLTKPFYGNKKHKITADVFGPEEKKPFLNITGEWNGVMEAKWLDKDPELFIDVNKLSIIRKQVLPINQQKENESRRLWREVTAGLKFNDIDKATNAKFTLEQKQREEAKVRKDTNLDWNCQEFYKISEDAWMYMKPLQHRLIHASKT